MSKPKIIDVHAHVLTEDMMKALAKEAPKVAPRMSRVDDESYVLDIAGVAYRPFPRGGWDVERRLKEMDTSGVDLQVLSAAPQTYYYDQDATAAVTFATIQNDHIAALVKTHPDRFMGIATLPMQAPEKAAAELRRAIQDLGLCGAMIGSNCEGKNLDDPSFEPLWAAAAQLDAFMFIHPVGVAGMDRLKSYYLRNLIGNPLDTTIAAACLVFGGVLERYPNLIVCLAHGGGFVPYQMGRWLHGFNVRNEPRVNLKGSPQVSIDRLLFDTILHAKPQLESMVGWVGARRVLLGSDYPYDMGMYDLVDHVRALGISDADKTTILGSEAERLLGRAKAHARSRATA